MKTTTTLTLALLLTIAVNSQERFYYVAPYEGMKADVERVSVKAYPVQFVDGKFVKNKTFSRIETSKFDENGQMYEKQLSVYDPFINMESKTSYEYDGKELDKQLIQRSFEGDKNILILKCVGRNDSTAVFVNQTSINKADTTYMTYDYEKQTMTSVSTKDKGTGSRFVTYYQNNREVKTEVYEDGQLRSSQVKFYDAENRNIEKIVVTRGDQTYRVELKHTKFDQAGNWTEAEMYENSLLRAIIERSVFYR